VTIARRNYGTGHGYKLDGIKAPGVTRILGMMPKDALSQWYGRTAADYAVNHWAELAKLPIMDRHKRIAGAANEERDTAARKGTAVHRYAEPLARGQRIDWGAVPDELAGHVRSYAAWLRRYDVDPVAIELLVANRLVGYCGTADLVAHLLGQVWLLELKTARSGIFRESALQACAYSRAETYGAVGEAEEHPLSGLGIERCGSVWIRSDGCDLRALDTGEEVWAYFCRLAANFAAEDDSREWVGELIDPPAPREELTA